jgi:IS30 family transposase
LTIVERLTRFTIIVKLKNATKEAVRSAIIKALSGYKVQSITSDNGTEFAGLAEVGRVL